MPLEPFVNLGDMFSSEPVDVACSNDGSIVFVVDIASDSLYKSIDSGASFVNLGALFSSNPIDVACSNDGTIVFVVDADSESLYRSGEYIPKTTCLVPIPLPATSNFPLNYGRFGYESTINNGTASASSDDIGSGRMLTPSTWDKWRPVLDPSNCTLIGTSKLCNYVGIAAHNLGSEGATVVVSVGDGATTTEVFNALVTSDRPLFIRFDEATLDRVFITISGTTEAEIAVVYLGKELEMMRPNYAGYSPATFSSTDVFTPQVSDGGQFLGKQLVRKGFATQVSFRHLTYEWYESEFQNFVEAVKTRPYFWAWNLLEHPNEVVYGWTNQNIKPTLMGTRNWFEVSFDIEAHGN